MNFKRYKMISWAVLVLGLWVLISPWVLDYSSLASAMWSNVVAGLLIVISALWALFGGNSSSSTPQQ